MKEQDSARQRELHCQETSFRGGTEVGKLVGFGNWVVSLKIYLFYKRGKEENPIGQVVS